MPEGVLMHVPLGGVFANNSHAAAQRTVYLWLPVRYHQASAKWDFVSRIMVFS